MTTEASSPVSNNQNPPTAGPGGPTLMQDYARPENMAHFNHNRVSERVVHATSHDRC